ncbi:FGGY-family carbohydrate kinase [Paludibacterium yongneupense]|uniref:FGGY-family carbohydrate kinase n=1 Tax=Paludibacterium yongneupense TaxID=400061 RepID=UPI000413C84E|nr:FGGY-family carbohydrate kinase [Paludibacterium yongneupense]
MSYWLGLDCGGTLIKAGIYDADGREYAIAREPLTVESPRPGWQERDMERLWQAAVRVIRSALAASRLPASSIAGVGISAQGKGLYLLDRQGQPLGRGILSSDQRALDQVRAWQQAGLPERVYPATLQTLWTGHPVSLLAWIKANDAERYAAIGSVLMAHDFLRFRLCGELACEISNISESNLFDMHESRYDPALAECFGIADIVERLPPVVGSAEVAGAITAEAAATTGLLASTPVVGGLFDVVATALCSGVVDDTRLNAVMGTWSVTSGVSSFIRRHPTANFVHGRHAQAGEYIIHEASPTSAINLEWVLRTAGGGAAVDYDAMNHAIAQLPPASSSLLFLPFLYGSNAGLGMHGCLFDMQAAHGRAHVLQAVYEGVVFSHLTHLRRMQQCFDRVEALRVTGGPSHSDVWMQMLADASGLPVEVPEVEETGCLGAALAAAVGGGVFSCFTEAVAALRMPLRVLVPQARDQCAYERKYQRYQHLIDCLRHFHDTEPLALSSGVPHDQTSASTRPRPT